MTITSFFRRVFWAKPNDESDDDDELPDFVVDFINERSLKAAQSLRRRAFSNWDRQTYLGIVEKNIRVNHEKNLVLSWIYALRYEKDVAKRAKEMVQKKADSTLASNDTRSLDETTADLRDMVACSVKNFFGRVFGNEGPAKKRKLDA
jgi:hypothetical protein